MASGPARLARYIDIWYAAAQDFVQLARGLDPADLSRPTDLPGWNVKAVLSHVAHLESSLAGNPQQDVAVPPAPHLTGPMSRFTESGTIARSSHGLDELVDEIETSVASRHDALLADPPADPAAPADGFAAVLGWSWERLLSNRPFDVWMHEQDVRRAVGRPGNLDSAAAGHAAGVLAASLPYVVGKKVAPGPGTTVGLDVTGTHGGRFATTVGEDGRAVPVDADIADPDVRLELDFESWIVLAGGRRSPADVTVAVTGDAELGQRVLAQLAVTP